ncbi:MAG TPA: hypothetical protein VKA30_04200, partial [Actinomycetota bacterium]|nr:hypothetical protein [Actinomycetota bacterium]
MTGSTARRLAWSTWAAAMVLAVGAVALQLASLDAPIPSQFGVRGFAAVFAVAFATVGAFVASRRPENPIGWLFCAAGLFSGIQEFTTQYGAFGALSHPGTLPAARYLPWVSAWIWVPITGIVVIYTVLLFPTGSLLSARWRPVLWVAPVALATFALSNALLAGPISNIPSIRNPFGIESLHDPLLAVGAIGSLLYVFCAAGALASLITRYRRSRGDERHQLRWFLLGAGLTVVVLAASFTFAFQPEQEIP